MKVLLITGSFPPMKCGVGDYTALLAAALSKQDGMSVAVLTDARADPFRADYNFEIFPVIQDWTLIHLPEALKTIKRWKPDVVHFQYPTQGYGNGWLPGVLPLLCISLNATIVQTWHEYCPARPNENLLLAATPGGLIAVRPGYKEKMPLWMRWLTKHKEFRYIPNASSIPAAKLSDVERLAIRERYLSSEKRLIAFFGFIYPHKQVELLFEIADPATDHIVLIGDLDMNDPYQKSLMEKTERAPWKNHVSITGFLSPMEAAQLLSAADAVALPFQGGGGLWNTSLHAAAMQGTFVLTTSSERQSYDSTENIYYAKPGDVEQMRSALQNYAGRKIDLPQLPDWDFISKAHVQLYSFLAG
ncbi:MAG: glycosyltransferase [Burkholderiales bacterium]